MARVSIKDLEIGSSIGGEVYLLTQSSVDKTRKGDPYLRATLADSTGSIEARYWDVPIELASQLGVGSGVRIFGGVDEYPAGSR